MTEKIENRQTEENKPSAAQKILDWSEAVRRHEAVSWERMPEIDLYMDQVITYLDKQFSLFQRNENAKLLTSSMINNYVKNGLLPRPDHKKYSRDHLAGLIIICMLKQVISIPDIASLFKALQENTETQTLYDHYCTLQKLAIDEVCAQVEQAAQHGDAELKQLAFTLSIEANTRRIAAERILNSFSEESSK